MRGERMYSMGKADTSCTFVVAGAKHKSSNATSVIQHAAMYLDRAGSARQKDSLEAEHLHVGIVPVEPLLAHKPMTTNLLMWLG